MNKYLLFGMCAIAFTGCEDNAKTVLPVDLPIGVKPGTRLTPKLLLADDGTLFLHPTIWKDSEYGECVFRTAADGQYRCLPNELVQIQSRYLDPSCIQEVFVFQPATTCAPMGLYGLIQRNDNACPKDGLTRVLKANKKVDAVLVFAKVGDMCLSQNIANDSEVYLLSEEIPASEFVSAWR